MLYYLFRYLASFGIPGAHLWSYISFRSILTMVLSLVISVWLGEWFIKWMRRHNGTETQRDMEIDPYGVEKKGTPTMGGVIIIIATVIPCLLLGRLRNIYMLLMILTTLWLGFLGFVDDYIKMKKSKDGMRPIFKLLGQAALGLCVGLTLWLSPDVVIRENVRVSERTSYTTPTGLHKRSRGLSEAIPSERSATDETVPTERVIYASEPVKNSITTIPFVKNNNLSYTGLFTSLGRYRTAAGWIFFVVVVTFVVMAVSNGANLNDGMDGMCAGNSAIMVLALAILAYVSSHIGMSGYLNIMFIPGSEELVIFLLAFMGALVGFLWYNAYPAQVFMGDTGSLAIGGIIAVTAVIIHKELLLPLICFVFLCESVSVLVQTGVAKAGNKRGEKWRFFKRAPIHDSFRVKPGQLPSDFRILWNWPRGCWLETKVTVRFWIVTIIMASLAIVTLKIR